MKKIYINEDAIKESSISLSKIKENLNELYSNKNHTHNEFLKLKNIIESLIDRIEIIENELNIDCVEDCFEDCYLDCIEECVIDRDNDNIDDEIDECVFDGDGDYQPDQSY